VARTVRDERGAAAVEFALVLPFLLALIVGVVEVGRGWDAKLDLSGAAREGARAAATGGDVLAAVQDAAGSLDPDEIEVEPPAVPCDLARPTVGQRVAVETTYPYTWEVPFVGERTVTLTARSVMRCGG
jgi:Flp pilus assembly pilin Flp